MFIVYSDPVGPNGRGYTPVRYMAALAARLFDATLVRIDDNASRLQQLGSFLPSRKGSENCLVICGSPTQLAALLLVEEYRTRFKHVCAWVFDSFWVDRIPRFARMTRRFDKIYVTEREDMGDWKSSTRTEVGWLGWGTDALRLGSASPVRPVDLLRYGRQPPAWESDLETGQACRAHEMTFAGRPPYLANELKEDEQVSLMARLAMAKFCLAFSNRVSPSDQTHPAREYLTARWVDALAAGATVAGVPPRSGTVDALLWPGALLDLKTTDRAQGLQVIASAVKSWVPEQARRNRDLALQKLDWRLRFEEIARDAGESPALLASELAALRQAIARPGYAEGPK